MKKSYSHLYYGDGKGKTSILNGSAIRALGAGKKIKYYRFLKNVVSSEDNIFDQLGIEFIKIYQSGNKFIWEMNENERRRFKQEMRDGFSKLYEDLTNSDYDLILADELLDCIVNKQITETELLKLLKDKKDNIEFLVSGHQVDPVIINAFDLVSYVKKEKHYFDTHKQFARKGIEL
ncbi:cob(I)yrinic acid a,c-diamide adenosyltransferase [Spiroplasma endosymbiont of Amphibalanus improvisus]|uniref:cob(I)yrinic acid a,c-diamide adenosyltransferase n=1 Tax=Spiroplasma endosymbiont of Amphibalanus improvisus TaxID=3066327 RepID=UPI00313DFC4A